MGQPADAWPEHHKEEHMDLFVLLTVGVLGHLFRRKRMPEPLRTEVSPPSITPLASLPCIPSTSGIRSPHQRLIVRALYGAVGALLLVAFALLPWPTIWPTSAAIAPDIQHLQAFVWHNVDLVTLGAISFAAIEPLIILLARALLQAPRTLWMCGRILLLTVYLLSWRIRRRQARRRWQQCLAHA